MGSVMLQFRHRGSIPSFEQIRREFDLEPGELDESFGVVETDPVEGLYTVLIDDSAVDRAQAAVARRPADPAEGVFANPKIEPFGPPEP